MAGPTQAQKEQLAQLTLGQGDPNVMRALIELAQKTGVTGIFINDTRGDLADAENVAVDTAE